MPLTAPYPAHNVPFGSALDLKLNHRIDANAVVMPERTVSKRLRSDNNRTQAMLRRPRLGGATQAPASDVYPRPDCGCIT